MDETGATKPGSTLYLRGIPVELSRRAKSHAARSGVTLTQFVIDALSTALEREAIGSLTNKVADPLERDISWYKEHRAELSRPFGDKYVAIIDQQVVDSDAEFGPLAERVFARFGVRPIFMPKCVSGERVIQVRSPARVAR